MRLDTFLKRHSWIVTALVVMVCSGLAANAVAHVIAATALRERSEPIRRSVTGRGPARPSAAGQDLAGSARSGDALVERNIFCSKCVPTSPLSDGAAVAADPDHPPITELPLRLVATTIGPLDARSFATIRDTSSSRQGAYKIGEEIPGAGRVTRIVGKYVDFENEASRRIERIPLFTRPPAPVVPALPPPPPPQRGRDRRSARAELLEAIDAGVRKLDDDSFEIDRALVGKLLANPMAASRGARIVPSAKNGKPNGFTLYAVRSTSMYAKIGFKTGDTIHAINGFEITSMDKALEVYTKLREASSLSVSITRRQRPMTLEYTIR